MSAGFHADPLDARGTPHPGRVATEREDREIAAKRKFDGYAFDSASKLRPGAEDVLAANRLKLSRKAYRPLLPALRKARRILDFGCGSGDFLRFLRETSDAELCGFDLSKSQLDAARARCRDLERVEWVSSTVGLDRSFDLVFCIHVIEHVPDAELPGFVASMLELLAPGGKLVIAAPNGLNPFAYAYFMSTDKTHVRMHSAHTLSELMRPFGYEVVGTHRETPQAYDFLSFAKLCVWFVTSQLMKPALHATAAGARGLRFPLLLAPTFYCVIEEARSAAAESDRGDPRDRAPSRRLA